jgi:hypothetical protein
MALRKCPGCRNIIAAETESCPICGCNPRTRRLRKFLFLGAALAGLIVLFQGQIRQHIPGLTSPAPVQAQTAVAPR